MDLFIFLHLFSFLPIIVLGGILWFERMSRHGGQKRTLFLFFSLLAMSLTGIFQTLAWTLRDQFPMAGLPIFAISALLYYISFMLLEYAIHCKRIDESFLTDDFIKGFNRVWILGGSLAVIALVAVFYYPAHEAAHRPTFFMETIFLDAPAKQNGIRAYAINSSVLTAFFVVPFLVLLWISGRSVFNLQEGVIRMRGYPFYTQILVTIAVAVGLFTQAYPAQSPNLAQAQTPFMPMWLFLFLNLAFSARMVEEFFFWSQFNLRSDRAKLEQRQHALNLLIRKVITSPEDEDRSIVKETVDNAAAKMKTRMVVEEYNITGLVVYRVHGNIIKVDDPTHLFGYCTPLFDNRSFKNLDKAKLNDQILKTSYEIKEIRETPLENIKDFGKKLIKQIMTSKEDLVLEELPENFLGLQRLIGLVPVFDGNNFMGFILVFKDSFLKLYPAEREILHELAENLGTIFALMNGKEIQKERNRLQGEMNTARNIQTSILPKKVAMPGYSIATFMETATEVGGDVYDIVNHPMGNYFGIGDVAGHGLPAGMMALISMAAFHGALETSKTLNVEVKMDNLYDIVNRVLCVINRDRIGSDKFMTQNYFREKDGVITHVGTHLVALLFKADKQEIVELTGLTDKTGFLGLSEYVVSGQSVGQFKMESKDILVLYSDGVSEAKNGNNTLYGLEGLKEMLLKNSDKTPEELSSIIYEDAKHFSAAGDMKKNGGRFSDDFSLFIIKKD